MLIKRLWTEEKPFDFHGEHHRLTGAFGNPKPVQRPHPPILVGGRSAATLRVAAEHADLWNAPGGDIADGVRRGALLDRYCAEIGRDPASIGRSIHLPVDTGRPDAVRSAVGEALEAGFRHFVLGLPAPFPEGIARWVAEEVIRPSAG
ncbi:FMNH(2)-dependent dimethylsulfone monooxygenase [Streptomyces sp. enrichment culture]